MKRVATLQAICEIYTVKSVGGGGLTIQSELALSGCISLFKKISRIQ